MFIDVDTSSAGFSTTPVYLTSLGGTSNHWVTTGGGSIYQPTASGFRIYVRYANGAPLMPDNAGANGWYVSWVAVG